MVRRVIDGVPASEQTGSVSEQPAPLRPGLRKTTSLIVIPARRASTRLPDKLLLAETGKSVLQHTIESALTAARSLGKKEAEARERVWVACDDPELAAIATACGVGVALVTEPCGSGTERIHLALPQLPPADVIVNLQADEPEMPPEWLTRCVSLFEANDPPDVATVAVALEASDPGMTDPNVVKVVLDHRLRALYFSRATIPHLRVGGAAPTPRALRHVGVYAYSREFLRNYDRLPASDLESCECLEQLRFLQAGTRIGVAVQPRPSEQSQGIDTAEDYRRFVERCAADRSKRSA